MARPNRTASKHGRSNLCSVPELKDRGWTPGMIKTLLGEHDEERENPMYKKAAPMKLFLKSRVEAAEARPEFPELRQAGRGRSAAASSGVATRIVNMVARVEGAELTIERGLTDDEIRDLASRTHGGNYAGDPGPFIWSKRTARNCIRHNLTNYERLWSLVNRGETGRTGYEVLRERVDALIDEAYPQFAREPLEIEAEQGGKATAKDEE